MAAPRRATAPINVLAGIVLIVGLAGIGWIAFLRVGGQAATPSPSPTPITHTVTGYIALISSSYTILGGGGCAGNGGYSDMAEGIPVILRDEHQTILASSTLEQGVIVTDSRCEFAFTLPNVTDSAKFYALTVSHRGELSKSHDELAAADWKFTLSLGA